MKNIIRAFILASLFQSPLQVFAAEKFWTEGSDQPNSKVNGDAKTLSPKIFLNVSEKVDEAVVNISTTQNIKGFQTPFGFQPDRNQGGSSEGENPFSSPFGPFFGPFGFGPSAPQTRKAMSLGSGFVINSDGYIVTNNHVIAKADEIEVTFYDESETNAKVIGRDPKTDLALIKVDRLPKKLRPVLLGNSDEMKVGEIVVAIGNPFGLSHSVTQGIISAKERAIGLGMYDSFIQTDASINPGNSGGPLLNLQGEVIGINTAIQAGGQGIGFAIPINLAKNILLKLKESGRVVRGQLGVQIQEINDDHVQALKLKSKQGALVVQVFDNTPAQRAGLKPGDVIVSFNGKPIKDSQQLPAVVADAPIGKRVEMEIVRNGSTKKLFAQTEEQKDETSSAPTGKDVPSSDPLGIYPKPLTPDLARSLGLDPKLKGVLVSEIDRDSVAFAKGIRRGDVIVELNQKRLSSVQEYSAIAKELKKGSSVLMLVVRAQGTLFIAFQL